MNVNTKTQQLYRWMRASIAATAVAFFLVASAAPIAKKVQAQSKAKSRQKPGAQSSGANQSATAPPIPDSEITDEMWAFGAIDKLNYLTAREAPELMDTLNKAPKIDYQINNDPDCPVQITAARIKGLKVEVFLQDGYGLQVNFDSSYLIIEDIVTLKNKTNHPIRGVSFSFVGSRGYRPVEIPPNGVVPEVITNRYQAIWAEPSIKVEGVDFKDGKVWGISYRLPRRPPPPPPDAPPPRIVKGAPPALPDIGLIRRTEQDLRASAVNSIELNKRQWEKGGGEGATVQLIIAPTGKVACAIFLSGPESIRERLIEAAKGWTFKPTPGMAVAGIIKINPN